MFKCQDATLNKIFGVCNQRSAEEGKVAACASVDKNNKSESYDFAVTSMKIMQIHQEIKS